MITLGLVKVLTESLLLELSKYILGYSKGKTVLKLLVSLKLRYVLGVKVIHTDKSRLSCKTTKNKGCFPQKIS